MLRHHDSVARREKTGERQPPLDPVGAVAKDQRWPVPRGEQPDLDVADRVGRFPRWHRYCLVCMRSRFFGRLATRGLEVRVPVA